MNETLRHPGRYVALAVVVVGWTMAPSPARGQEARAARTSLLVDAIAGVEAGRRTTPLVSELAPGGDVTVTFLAKRERGRSPRIVSDVTGWGEQADGTFDVNAGRMTRVGRSEWYSLQAKVVPRARIEYLIAYGPGDYRLDPHNPRHVDGPPASEFITPGYEPPQELVDPPAAPAGMVTETIVESRALGGVRRVIVYTPSGDHDLSDAPVAVFLDTRSGQIARVLDWLIARHRVEPLVAAFVGSEAPVDSGRSGEPMRTFLTEELPAWLAARHAVTREARNRAVIAISYGAKDALDAAVNASDGFGRVGLLIPGRRIGRADIDAIRARGAPFLRVAILAGQYDQANVATARSVRQAFAGAGHSVNYTEVPEGHSPRTWLNHLRVVLVSLFGPPDLPDTPHLGHVSAWAQSPLPARRLATGDRRQP